MGFFGGLFGGQDKTLNKDISSMGGLATFLTNTGTSDVATSSDFMKKLLSGNSTEVNQLLAPQVAGIQGRAKQEKQQLGQFGNRSGGTTGSMLAIDDSTHAQINDMIAKLTGGAVSDLASTGGNLVAQGAQDLNSEAALSAKRMENWRNSILGKGVSTAVQGAEAFGLGAAGGAMPGGPGAAAGGQGALASFLG